MTRDQIEAKQMGVDMDPMAGCLTAEDMRALERADWYIQEGLKFASRLGLAPIDADSLKPLTRARVLPSITLTLPYPVSANRYWKSFRLGRRMMTAPSAEATAYKREVARLVKQQGVREPFAGRVRVDLKLYPARPQDWQARKRKQGAAWDDTVRCLDLDNARKVVYDALRGLAFEDDRWVRQDSGERMGPDEHGARLVVVVTQLTEQQQ